MIDEQDDGDEFEYESVFDQAAEEGTRVYCHHWRTLGRPDGFGWESVYELDGQFYYLSDDYESTGPFPTLAAALDAHEPLTQVSGTTVSIESSVLDDAAIIARLQFVDAEQEYEVAIDHMTEDLRPDDTELVRFDRRSYEDAEDEYLIDGKSIRINQTRYEFRAPATLIPMGPASPDDDDPSESWDSEDDDADLI